jgi:ParB family chromosome partitioning protein
VRAFVTLGGNGQLQIERGFVRAEDEQPVEADEIGAGEQRDDEPDAGGDNAGGVVVNGKPANDASATGAAGDEAEDDGIKALPDRLVYDLTAQRTLAMRNALAGDPDVAFVAALHAFVLQAFYRFAPDTCLEISVKSSSFQQVQDLGETVWAKEIVERHEAWDRDLPDEEKDLWDFLLGLDEASRKALFAHCVSLSLNAVLEPWNRRPRALAHADMLAGSLGFDMVSAGWTPTVDNYLGRVTKVRILQAVREARGEESAQLIDHLKKDHMAREAARLLEGSNWLPEPLRNPDDASAAADLAPDVGVDAEESAADLPAFLSEEADVVEPVVEAAE